MSQNSDGELILGIDPGSLKTGFGLVRRCEGRMIHVSHGTIVLAKEKSVACRLRELAKDLSHIVMHYKPSIAVVEDVFFCSNARSALVLGQARGAVLAVLGMCDVAIETLAPTEAKSLISGRGRADKAQIACLVSIELSVPKPSSVDASDALALALAYAHKSSWKY